MVSSLQLQGSLTCRDHGKRRSTGSHLALDAEAQQQLLPPAQVGPSVLPQHTADTVSISLVKHQCTTVEAWPHRRHLSCCLTAQRHRMQSNTMHSMWRGRDLQVLSVLLLSRGEAP